MATQDQDHITRLPRSAAARIFEFAYGSEAYSRVDHPARLRSLTSPICKALLPVQRAELYRDVRVTSYSQFGKFSSTAQRNGEVAKAVKGMVLDVGWAFHGGVADPIKQETVDPFFPSTATVLKLFEALSNLQSLVVVGSSRLAEAVLSPAHPSARFQSLESLVLHSTFDGFQDPSFLTHFAPLEHFPAHLDIRTPLAKSWRVVEFMQSFPSLTSLCIHDSSGADAYPSTIKDMSSALPVPSLLEHLTLEREDPTRTLDVSTILPFLVRVRTLVLGGEGLQIKTAGYRALNKLPLTTLSFTLGLKGVRTAELTKLISGATKHPSIELLDLSNVKHDSSEGLFPDWSKAFQPKGLEKLLVLAEKEGGPEITGDAIYALEDDEGVDAEVLENIEVYKQRYRNFAINCEAMAAGMY